MECKCAWCGTRVERYPSQVRKMVFCSRGCLAKYRSKKYNPDGRPVVRHEHLSEYNRLHNPERMSPEVRQKLRNSRLDTGNGRSYKKYYGRHEHRIVAEKMLGRELRPGEVVHHINGDKRDNRPANLMVFASQAEHARWHAMRKGVEEVEIRTT